MSTQNAYIIDTQTHTSTPRTVDNSNVNQVLGRPTDIFNRFWQRNGEEVARVLAEHTIITDDNELLLACAWFGLVPRLRALLQAGANAAYTNKVRVRTPSSKKLANCL